MDKKAQGLPITTIIIAILGLVVLVILFAILTGRLTIFAGAASECPGVCVYESGKIPSGATETAGILEGAPKGERTSATSCIKDFEKQLFGRFIAQGMRADEGKPIPCKACCQRLI